MGIADRLKCVNIERAIEPLHAPTHALVAGGQAIAFIERLGYHNPIFAIHEIHGRGVLEGDSDSQLQARQTGALKQLIVAAHNFNDLARQNASAAYRKTFVALALEQSKNNCVRSEEHTSELQSRFDLVCRLLLEKKKT